MFWFSSHGFRSCRWFWRFVLSVIHLCVLARRSEAGLAAAPRPRPPVAACVLCRVSIAPSSGVRSPSQSLPPPTGGPNSQPRAPYITGTEYTRNSLLMMLPLMLLLMMLLTMNCIAVLS